MRSPGAKSHLWISIVSTFMPIAWCYGSYVIFSTAVLDNEAPITAFDVTEEFESADFETGNMVMELTSSKPVEMVISVCDDIAFEIMCPTLEQIFIFTKEWQTVLRTCKGDTNRVLITIEYLAETRTTINFSPSSLSTPSSSHHLPESAIHVSQGPFTSIGYLTKLETDVFSSSLLDLHIETSINESFALGFAKCDLRTLQTANYNIPSGVPLNKNTLQILQLLSNVFCVEDTSSTFQTVITTRNQRAVGYLKYTRFPNAVVLFIGVFLLLLVVFVGICALDEHFKLQREQKRKMNEIRVFEIL